MKEAVKITYLAHSGFAVEIGEVALVFDYYKGELPASLQKKKTYVFASHAHEDHFQKEILGWAADRDVTYILSRDIHLHGRQVENLHRVIPRREYTVDDLRIWTLRSTDVGVAFLCFCKGTLLYHAGDLHWWRWEGEPDADNARMEKNYKYEMEQLQLLLKKEDLQVDVAFLPLDYRQEADYHLGFDWFMRSIGAKKAFPMHCWGVYKTIDRLLKDPISEPYRESIVSITKRGEVFEC